jgi:hypothetical protein
MNALKRSMEDSAAIGREVEALLLGLEAHHRAIEACLCAYRCEADRKGGMALRQMRDAIWQQHSVALCVGELIHERIQAACGPIEVALANLKRGCFAVPEAVIEECEGIQRAYRSAEDDLRQIVHRVGDAFHVMWEVVGPNDIPSNVASLVEGILERMTRRR